MARRGRARWLAAVALAAAAGCARAPVAVEPADASVHRASSEHAQGSAEADADEPWADADGGADPAGEGLVEAFRDALLRELPAEREAGLRSVDVAVVLAVPRRAVAYLALDRAARGALPGALEGVVPRRAARLRAMRPIASVHALEVLREVLAGAVGQAGRQGSIACDGSACDDAPGVGCALRAADLVYQAMEDLESAEEDAMEPQRWAPDGAPFRYGPAGAASVGRAGEPWADADPDLYRAAVRSAARAVATAWVCTPRGGDGGADDAEGDDLAALQAVAALARGAGAARMDAGR